MQNELIPTYNAMVLTSTNFKLINRKISVTSVLTSRRKFNKINIEITSNKTLEYNSLYNICFHTVGTSRE